MTEQQQPFQTIEPEDYLPFITKGDDGTVNYWSVPASGDSRADRMTGLVHGLYYLEYLLHHKELTLMDDILRSMLPDEPTPAMLGFLESLCATIAFGHVTIGSWEASFCRS